MSRLIKLDKEYAEWIENLGKRFRNMQIKAATSVNREMLIFYWYLGKDIVKMSETSKYGSNFINAVSRDLKDILPEQHSFSPTNLGYMRRFYLLYSRIYPQVGGDFAKAEIYPQVGGVNLQMLRFTPKLGRICFLSLGDTINILWINVETI